MKERGQLECVHDIAAGSSATDSSPSSVFQKVEIVFQLTRADGRCLIDEMSSIFQRLQFEFCNLREILPAQKYRAIMASNKQRIVRNCNGHTRAYRCRELRRRS